MRRLKDKAMKYLTTSYDHQGIKTWDVYSDNAFSSLWVYNRYHGAYEVNNRAAHMYISDDKVLRQVEDRLNEIKKEERQKLKQKFLVGEPVIGEYTLEPKSHHMYSVINADYIYSDGDIYRAVLINYSIIDFIDDFYSEFE